MCPLLRWATESTVKSVDEVRVYCVCRMPELPNTRWIECSDCKRWYIPHRVLCQCTKYSSFYQHYMVLSECFWGDQNFQGKINFTRKYGPGNHFFQLKFWSPDQFFQDQNSSDSTKPFMFPSLVSPSVKPEISALHVHVLALFLYRNNF